jgi:hypothetical protein
MDITQFQIIKRDLRQLKTYIFDNTINEWTKVIVIYNMILFFNQVQIAYVLLDSLVRDTNTQFINQFKNVYLFFFLLCNIRNSYLYFIVNVSKINKELASNLYSNTKEYFF